MNCGAGEFSINRDDFKAKLLRSAWAGALRNKIKFTFDIVGHAV